MNNSGNFVHIDGNGNQTIRDNATGAVIGFNAPHLADMDLIDAEGNAAKAYDSRIKGTDAYGAPIVNPAHFTDAELFGTAMDTDENNAMRLAAPEHVEVFGKLIPKTAADQMGAVYPEQSGIDQAAR